MERGIFIGLAVALLTLAAFIPFLLLRGAPLHRRAQNEVRYPRNESCIAAANVDPHLGGARDARDCRLGRPVGARS